MAITPIATIKNWFRTNLIPTESQFWSVFDSYRHKSEKVPVADVEGINELIAPFNTHANDPNAHATLFAKARFFQPGEFQIFKNPINNDPAKKYILEIKDVFIGFVAGQFIKGVYLGGDTNNLESYDVSFYIEFLT